jgi:NDP-sugar pyrophosphorylase family protein
MKAVLLAAGKGTRLRPLTDEMPKVMIPILGKPILEHHVEHLARAGIREIFINLHHLPERITSHFGDGEKWGVRIRYSFEPEILGTAGAVKKLEAELRGAPFIVVYADNFSEFDFADFISWSEKASGVGTVAVFEKEDVAGSGVVDIGSGDRIVRFLEKPAPDKVQSHWVNAGIYRLSEDIFDAIPSGYSDFGHDIFPEAIKRGKKLFAYRSKEPTWAIDHLELLDELSQRLGT